VAVSESPVVHVHLVLERCAEKIVSISRKLIDSL
jgi:hypothetical protein